MGRGNQDGGRVGGGSTNSGGATYVRKSTGTIPSPTLVAPVASPAQTPDMAQVSAAAQALMPVAQQLLGTTGEIATEVDAQGAAKKGKKNEKVKCYRCGFTGHVLSDCTVIIRDYCEKVDHISDVCPLLSAPKP